MKILWNITFVAIGILAIIAWPRFLAFHHDRVFHVHEQFHYGVTTKYFSELGYFNLYPAALQAGREIGSADLTAVKFYRSQKTYLFETVSSNTADLLQAKGGFSSTRWSDFKSDIGRLDTIASGNRWSRMVADKGYNPSPGWTYIAQLFSSNVNLTIRGYTVLASLDFVLLLWAFICVLTCYGPLQFALITVGFCLSPYCTYSYVGGGFLRHDWFCALVFGLCAIRRNWWVVGGLCFAYAVMARVFPLLLLAPFAICFFQRYRDSRLLTQGVLRFTSTFLIVLTALFLASSLRFGFESWLEWINKIEFHSKDISPKRIGMDYLFVYEGERYLGDLNLSRGPNGRAEYESHKEHRRSNFVFGICAIKIVFVFGLCFVLISRRLSLEYGTGLSFLLIPILTSPADYYLSYLAIASICLFGDPSCEKKNSTVYLPLLILFQFPLYAAIERSGFVMEFRQFVLSSYNVFLFVFALIYVWLAQSGNYYLAGSVDSQNFGREYRLN